MLFISWKNLYRRLLSLTKEDYLTLKHFEKCDDIAGSTIQELFFVYLYTKNEEVT